MTLYSGIENLEVMSEAVNYNAYLRALIDTHIRADDRVLDFGAGSGTFALPLLARGFDLVCVEPDPHLREILSGAHAPAVATLADVPPASIDFVYSFNVLEHIRDDRAAIQGLAERLKERGRLLLYVPAFSVLFSAMDRKVGHHRRYRRSPVIAMLEKAGFAVHSAAYVDSLGFAVTMGYRLIGDNGGSINRTALKIYDRAFFPLSRMTDRALGRWVGKNLVVVAEKRPGMATVPDGVCNAGKERR